MSLTKPIVPLDILRAFTTGLADFVDPSKPLWSLLSQSFVALEAYNLKLSSFPEKVERWDLNTSILSSGWRFWAAENDLFGACHVGSTKPGLPPKLTGFSNAVQVLNAVESFDQLRTMPELAAGTFEPRVLRITWHQLEAFWLRSTIPGVEDRFVVYTGFPPKKLDPTQSHSWAEFSQAISEGARQAGARALNKDAAYQEAQARAAKIQAAGAAAIREQANAQQKKADEASQKAARAQVQANVNEARSDQVQIALPELSRKDADDLVEYGQRLQGGYKKWEHLLESHQKKIQSKRDRIGFGPQS